MPATHKVISADSHIVEPPDLWTSRAPAKYKDQVPHMVHGKVLDEWWIGNEFIQPAASTLVQAQYRNQVYEGKQFGKLKRRGLGPGADPALGCGYARSL